MSRVLTRVLLVVVALFVAVSLAVAQEGGEKKKGGKRPSAEDMFKRLDKNSDGKLTKEEFMAAPRGKKGGDEAKAKERQERMWKRLTADAKDKEAVTLDEYKAAMKKMREEFAKKRGEKQGENK